MYVQQFLMACKWNEATAWDVTCMVPYPGNRSRAWGEQNPRQEKTWVSPGLEFSTVERTNPLALCCRKARGVEDSQMLGRGSLLPEKSGKQKLFALPSPFLALFVGHFPEATVDLLPRWNWDRPDDLQRPQVLEIVLCGRFVECWAECFSKSSCPLVYKSA